MKSSLGSLRRVVAPPAPGPDDATGPEAVDERCEMCNEPIGGEHGHVADLEARRLMCTCRGCYLLFTSDGAGGKRFRALPTRFARVTGFRLSPAQWDRIQIPVDFVFFLHQSVDDRTIACYPGPGGATESLLDLDSWTEVVDDNPVLRDVADDVEAILLRRDGGSVECFIVPVDTCYELVGLVRQYWIGFAGGEELWQHVDEFFDRLRSRSAVIPRECAPDGDET